MFAPEFVTIGSAGLRLLRQHQVAVRPPFDDELISWSSSPLTRDDDLCG